MGDRNHRDDFSKPVRDRVALRAAYQCSNPSCLRPTVGASSESEHAVANIGEAAHICAAASGGRRFDVSMTAAERSSIGNAIWLCASCATLIDRDEATYTVDALRGWKSEHEARTADTLAGKRAASDRRIVEALSGLVGLSPETVESKMDVPPPSASQRPEVEFLASAIYSQDKDAVVVVAELGNASARRVTIRDASLQVDGLGELQPREVWGNSFYVEGHEWVSAAPYAVEPDALVKIAWYFHVAGSGLKERLEARQPIPSEITVRCFPTATITQKMDLYSITKLRELSGP